MTAKLAARSGPRVVPLPFGADPRTMQAGACVGQDPRLFDEKPTTEPIEDYRKRARQAIAICDRCPIKQACLRRGIANKDSGIVGGRELLVGKPQDHTGTHPTRDSR